MVAPRRRPPTSSNLIDEKMSGVEECIKRHEVAVGILATRYIVRCSGEAAPIEGAVLTGFAVVTIARIQCYTTGE